MSEPLHILLVSPIEPYPPHGGWQTVIYNDAKYLASLGHKITLLALTYDPAADPEDLAGIADAEYFLVRKRPKWLQVMANLGRRKGCLV